MKLLNMIKKWLLFLIALIATGSLGVLYSIFEVRILQLLSTWPKDTWPQSTLRISLGAASCIILSLAYWVTDLKGKESSLLSKIIDQRTSGSFTEKTINNKYFDSLPKSSLHSLGYKTDFFVIDNLKWEAHIYPLGEFNLDRFPLCAVHDRRFILEGDKKYCPVNDCTNQVSDSDFFKLYESAKSFIEHKIRNGK